MLSSNHKERNMTIDKLISKLMDFRNEHGNTEVVVRARDEDIVGYYDKDLKFDYVKESALVKNALVL